MYISFELKLRGPR